MCSNEFNPQAAVQEFHDAFGFHVESVPAVPPERIRYERALLIAEEAAELVSELLAGGPAYRAQTVRALFTNKVQYTEEPADLVKIAGETADLAYVTYGGAVNAGIPLNRVIGEVHRANMAKLNDNGRPIVNENGKAQKPEGWTPPNISWVLLGAFDTTLPDEVCVCFGRLHQQCDPSYLHPNERP